MHRWTWKGLEYILTSCSPGRLGRLIRGLPMGDSGPPRQNNEHRRLNRNVNRMLLPQFASRKDSNQSQQVRSHNKPSSRHRKHTQAMKPYEEPLGQISIFNRKSYL